MNDVMNVSGNQIATTEDFKEVALDYLRGMGLKLPQKFEKQFIELSQLYGLNPFKREIYAVGYGENWNVITGYEVYLKRAERTGKLDGWECEITGRGEDMTATIIIHRKDWNNPFKHTVLYSECVQLTKEGRPNKTWAKMPSFMLKKVAMGQGFRLCFPDEMGGMPYLEDELPEIEKPSNTLKSANIEPTVATSATVAPKVEANADIAVVLENILNTHKDVLNVATSSGNPYEMAMDVLKKGTDVDIGNMITRCKKFLSMNGVAV